ncbi:MAG TPA: methionine ABC transporter permease [Gammaproteobacteria bacterium]|nr:methionine ABC transporter permease [Gammaproteobacteria bacterium]
MWTEILKAIAETLEMVFISGFFCVIIGLPLGTLLYITRRGNLWENLPVNYLLGTLINATRSIPFIILMLALFPITRLIVGTSIGLYAALVPLSIAAIPFFARLVETSLNEVPQGLIEAVQSMGASKLQIIRKVLISEALPGITSSLTLTLVNLVGYSAMAGAIGAGGLGKLAYHYGANRFDTMVMVSTVIIMIIIVQSIQSAGDYVVHKVLSR